MEIYRGLVMKILYLTLYKKWFKLILNKKKKIEYREIKPFWTKKIENNKYTHIQFRNGYNKTAPTLLVTYKGYSKNKTHYLLYLGNIIKKSYMENLFYENYKSNNRRFT